LLLMLAHVVHGLVHVAGSDQGAVLSLNKPVSPARPPNRTCDFNRVRLSTKPGR
jgi:hypothetical protein